MPILAALNNNNTLYEFCTKLRAYYESLTPYCVLLLHIFDIIDGRKSLVERELTDDVFYSMFHRLVRPGGDWRRLGGGEQESRPKLFEYLSTHTNLPNLKAFVEFLFYDVRQVRNKIAHAANLNVELKQNKQLRKEIEVLHRNKKSLDMVSYLLDYYLLCI